MRQLNLVAPYTLSFEEAPEPQPGPGEVVLKVAYTGICGSDLHSYRGRHPVVRPPIVLGHEASGVVVNVGEGVPSSYLGRAAAVFPGLSCGHCARCIEGKPHICENLRVVGNVGWPGSLAEYLKLPLSAIVPLPDNMPLGDGAVVEPTAVAVHAVKKAMDPYGPVLVLGAGPIGIMVLQAARAMGATRIAIADVRPDRLHLSQRFAPDATINAGNPTFGEEVKKALGTNGPQVIFDCVATPSSLRSAFSVVRKGTTVVLVGVPEEPAVIDVARLQDWEIDLRGTLMYRKDDFEAAIAYLQRGLVRTDGFVTRIVGFDEVPRVFQELSDATTSDLKVLVRIGAAQV